MTVFVFGVVMLAMGSAQSLPDQPGQETAQPEVRVTSDKLQQLVAPIALYPDALVAQLLAASTYPTQIVEADRWLQRNSQLQGEQLAAAVDTQPWDPSVKALTEFPTVLANMDRNISWTTALGEAYFNQQQDTLDAVQVMRHRAEDAGNLQSSPQERVVNEGPTIVVEPSNPAVCYVPIYDPWVVYGAPLAIYPGYFYNAWYGPPYISFGPAIGLGFFGGFGWGWPAWGFNWGSRVLVFNRAPFISHSHIFFPRGPFIGRGGWSGRSPGFPVRTDRGFYRNRFAPNAHSGVNGWTSGELRSSRSDFLSPMHSGRLNQGSVSSGGFRVERPGVGGLGRGFGRAGHGFGGGRNFGGGHHR